MRSYGPRWAFLHYNTLFVTCISCKPKPHHIIVVIYHQGYSAHGPSILRTTVQVPRQWSCTDGLAFSVHYFKIDRKVLCIYMTGIHVFWYLTK